MLAISVQSNLYGFKFPDRALLLSYLPLAHIYEVFFLSSRASFLGI
jgi:hypothetical protein